MARTPLLRNLKDALSIAVEAGEGNLTAGEVHAGRQTRRQFVKRAGVIGAGALVVGGGIVPTAAAAGEQRRGGGKGKDDATVVVVGAGLAGLTAAYRLKRRGVRAIVLEGNTRLGGRCFSGRGDSDGSFVFDDHQIIEHGGELIDTGHKAIRKLARDLGLDLDDVLRAEPKGTTPVYYFDGAPYTIDQAVADFQAIYPALQADSVAAGYPTLYTSFTAAGQALDNLSVRDWINSRVPGGIGSKLGQLLDVAYNIEYGSETTDQSSLNLIYLLSGSLQTPLDVFGASDERFKVRGGNDLIVQRLADELGNQVVTGAKLTSIKANGDASVTLGVSGIRGGHIEADHVVIAIPFTTLREVDFSQAGFNAVKTTAIQNLELGSNTKLQLQFNERYWNKKGYNGSGYGDTGYQATWEVTRAQDGRKGILVDYTGGAAATALVGANPTTAAQAFLAQFEPALPGITAKWNGKATLDAWKGNPWSQGAYSYWRVGQYVQFSGAEGERSGNIHFAGEHCSTDFQGYLNGAVDTGISAAKEILSDLRVANALVD